MFFNMFIKNTSMNVECHNIIDNQMSVFSVLNEEEKELLKKNSTCTYYKKNDIIYKEGDKPSGLICLSKGKVKIFANELCTLRSFTIIENDQEALVDSITLKPENRSS